MTDWLPALPLFIVAFTLLVAPIGAMVIRSFFDDAGAFTIANWTHSLSRHANQLAILNSLELAFVSATISLLIGGPIAWIISRMVPIHRFSWLAIFNVVINFSGIGLAFAYIATLGTLGMVTLTLKNLALPFVPPAPSSFWGLLIAYEYTNVPLFVLLTLPAMGIIREEWWEAAQTASATRLQFWRAVGLPILAPFLAAGWLLIFTWAVGMYDIPFALSGGVFTVRIRLITLQMGIALQTSVTSMGEVSVLAVILLLIATISLFAYRLMIKRATRWVS